MKPLKKILFGIIACLMASCLSFVNVFAETKSFGSLHSGWSVFPAGCTAETYIAAVASAYAKGTASVSCWDLENATVDYGSCFKKSGVDEVRCFLDKLKVSNARGIEGGLQPVKNKTTCNNVMTISARLIAGQQALLSKGSQHMLITKVSATKKNGKWQKFKFHGVFISGKNTTKSNTGSGTAMNVMKKAQDARAALTWVGKTNRSIPSYGNICGS